MTPLKQRGKIRRTNIYTKGGRSDGQIYILRGKIRRTNISTIRLNNMTPLKQRGKIRVDIFVRLIVPLCFSEVMLFNLIVDIFVRLIFPLSIYICPSDLLIYLL
jgi:hypothetical protein